MTKQQAQKWAAAFRSQRLDIFMVMAMHTYFMIWKENILLYRTHEVADLIELRWVHGAFE